MRRSRFWIAAWLALGMSACTTLRPPQSPQPPRPDNAKACADWRWIGISRPGAQCPDIPGWTVRTLFPQVSPAWQTSEDYCAREEKVPGPEVIRELSRFCVYEVARTWLAHAELPPPKNTELVRLDQDCAALSASGETDLDAQAVESSSRRFLAQAGPPATPFTIAEPYGVRLAFLDTQPDYVGVPEWPGNSPHGYALANIGQHLVCAAGSCAARITTRLALPIIEFNARSRDLTRRDETNGGFLGMQSDLAGALWGEVNAWQRDRQRGSTERHLVLNLSLAWDPDLFGGLDEGQIAEMRAGTQAVYRALQYAAGFDALVLAAAGNERGEPCSNFGPLLPAAWEIGGPRDESCREPQKALLYAVGGVGADGAALVNARPGGMPRRAAYGEKAVVSCLDPTRHTAMLTGSSVATTVVSSIAAVVWASFPELSSSEVMAILDASGDQLPMPGGQPMEADFWFGASLPSTSVRPKVHRLSLCSALEQACSRPGSTCPVQVRCDRSRLEPSAAPGDSHRETWVPDSCQPWIHPQPESPLCLSCGGPGG